MSSSFGQWYDNQRAAEAGVAGPNANSSLFSSLQIDVGDAEAILPLFQKEALQNFSFSNMKASMEAQMPQKIMGLGYQERFKVFCALLFVSALFFALAFFVGLPMITIRPQKFALSFTMGSLLFMGSFGILKGPKEHLMGMLQADRIVFTFIYLGSLLSTLYVTFNCGGVTGYLLVIAASAAQLLALLWYLISFLPGGSAGLYYVMAVMGMILKPVFVACARMQAYCLGKCLGMIMSSSNTASL